MRLIIGIAVGLALIPSLPLAQSARMSVPPARAHHALVYDAARMRVLLIGGSTPINNDTAFEFFDDTWAFDGAGWTNLGPAGSRRSGRAVAYDATRRRVLSFGGYCGCADAPDGRFADFMELSAATWKLLGQLADRPTADAGLVYDTRRDRAVLFGGSGPKRHTHGDTREFDGAAWHTVAAQGPEPRNAFAMVYDERRSQTVVFGGFIVSARTFSGETWVYDGASWTRAANTGPSPRLNPGLAYDSKRGRVVLFGGLSPDGALQDTWAWDGKQWTKLAESGPPARMMGALAYDAARDRVVLFGGRVKYPDDRNDTWEWDGEGWREVRPSVP